MSAQERMLWGVRYSDDVLRLRTTGPRKGGALGLVVAVAAFGAASTLGTEEPTIRIFFWTFHSRLAVLGVCGLLILAFVVLLLFGSVVATRTGIERRWLGVRRVSWDDVDFLQVVERVPPWMFFGPWFGVDVVEVATRSGRRLKLWPTRSTVARRTGNEGPSSAQMKRDLLQRYRECYAPVRKSP